MIDPADFDCGDSAIRVQSILDELDPLVSSNTKMLLRKDCGATSTVLTYVDEEDWEHTVVCLSLGVTVVKPSRESLAAFADRLSMVFDDLGPKVRGLLAPPMRIPLQSERAARAFVLRCWPHGMSADALLTEEQEEAELAMLSDDPREMLLVYVFIDGFTREQFNAKYGHHLQAVEEGMLPPLLGAKP